MAMRLEHLGSYQRDSLSLLRKLGLDLTSDETLDQIDVLLYWSDGVGDEYSLWVHLKADSQRIDHFPGLSHIATPDRSTRFKPLPVEIDIRTYGVHDPEAGSGIVGNFPPTVTDEPVRPAVENHGMAHAQLFPEKCGLKVIGEVSDALQPTALGWVSRYPSSQGDIH
jgi:hypothetical protein